VQDLGIDLAKPVGIAFVADEETGNTYGIQHLLAQDIFQSNDLLIVPDAGFPAGNFVEIAEKTILWLRIEVTGKQTHASTPHLGLNAHRIGIQFALALDALLHERFPSENALFKPPTSTFEPTKKEKNQENVNAVPGKDVLYFDCRLLPDYPVEDFKQEVEQLRAQFEQDTGATIAVDFPNTNDPTPPTPADSPVVELLSRAIQTVRGCDVVVGGVGGGTCAAYFRGRGIPAAVYERTDEQAHKPNEYCVLEWLLEDLSIFAMMMLSD
jgi:succinyl-diaminopimelate desuccinylase